MSSRNRLLGLEGRRQGLEDSHGRGSPTHGGPCRSEVGGMIGERRDECAQRCLCGYGADTGVRSPSVAQMRIWGSVEPQVAWFGELSRID